MSTKSSVPLLLGIGAVAFLIVGKRKTVSESAKSKKEEIKYLDVTYDQAGDERLKFDEECSSIINKMNMEEHNNWITNRYFELLSEGQTDLSLLTIQLLKDQGGHCPWGNRDEWTPVMTGLYEQLFSAVQGWHAQTSG